MMTFNIIAQFPMQDNFNHVDGPGEWQINHGFLYEDQHMGVENGWLTYNQTPYSYLDARQYEYQSPDYTTLFDKCGCDSIKVTMEVDMNIRKFDQVKFFYILTPNIPVYKVIPTSGVHTFTLPPNIKYFTLNLITWGGTSTLGKYVKWNYFRIECVTHPLPVTFLEFDANPKRGIVELNWSTASELNNDYFTLEKSSDAISYTEITKVYSEGTTYSMRRYNYVDSISDGVTYYRLKQTDFNGSMKILAVRSVYHVSTSNLLKIVNSMGQTVPESFDGLKFYVYDDHVKKHL